MSKNISQSENKPTAKTKTTHKKPITKPRNKSCKGRRRQFTNVHLKLFEPPRIGGEEDQEETDTDDESDSKYSRRTLTDNSSRYEVPEEESIVLSENSESETDEKSINDAQGASLQLDIPANLENEVENLLSLNKTMEKDNATLVDLNIDTSHETFSKWLDENL